jgi:hypothetical protein
MQHTPVGADAIELSLDEMDLATLLSLKDTPLGSILQEVVEQKVAGNEALQEMNWRDKLLQKHIPHSWHTMHSQHRMHSQHSQHRQHSQHFMHRMHTMHYQHRMHSQHFMHRMHSQHWSHSMHRMSGW